MTQPARTCNWRRHAQVNLYQILPRRRTTTTPQSSSSGAAGTREQQQQQKRRRRAQDEHELNRNNAVSGEQTGDQDQDQDEGQGEYPLRLLDIRRIDLNSNGWETFYVKRAVEDWLRDARLNLGK